MWPWLPKRLRKRTLFFTELLLFTTVLHLLILVVGSVLQIQKKKPVHLTISPAQLNTNVQVVFMPLYKQVTQQPVTVTNNTEELTQNTVKNDAPKKIPAPVMPKKQQKKAHTTVQDSCIKQVEQKKKTALQSKAKKTVSVPSKQQNKKLFGSKKQRNTAKKVKRAQTAQQSNNTKKIYVGRNELTLLQIQARIQQEVSTVWKPPAGLPQDLSCEIALVVGSSGSITKIDIKKSSGVLLYDVSARIALAQLTLPNWAYNKEFCITFKQ